MACTPPGWSTQAWGWTPWGSLPGGNIPFHEPFTTYCVGPCGEMEDILAYLPVSISGDFGTKLPDQDLCMWSIAGPSGVAIPTVLTIEHVPDPNSPAPAGTPPSWTLELTAELVSLPTEVENSVEHVWFGVWDEDGNSVGIYVSQTQIGWGPRVGEQPIGILTPAQLNGFHLEEGVFYTFRISVNDTTQAVFIYITKTDDLLQPGGTHALRAIVPLPGQVGSHTEATTVSVRGSAGHEVHICLDSICLAPAFMAPNMPPIADAGEEQEIKLCTLGELDGTGSYDPEGSPLIYYWRLTDGPVASQYVFEGLDGSTQPLAIPTGFTNILSTTLMDDEFLSKGLPIGIGSGDVLLIEGIAYDIIAVNATEITISGEFLEDNWSAKYFKVLKQSILDDPSSPTPHFYPDAPGFYRFELMVSDGGIFSEPDVTVVAVRESPMPRGCTPNVGFIWTNLSDFWSLVEEREVIETVWSAITQIAAGQLLTLWQVDYNKSLRDIQRSMVRKWLYYDLLIQEPFYDLTEVKKMDNTTGFLTGAGGVVQPPPLGGVTYDLDADYSGEDIQEHDWLILEGVGYRIKKTSVVGGVTRLTLYDAIYNNPPIPSLPDWTIARPTTSSQIDFWSGLVVAGDNAFVEVLNNETGEVLYLQVDVLGAAPEKPGGVALDPTEYLPYTDNDLYTLHFIAVFRRKYTPINDRILDVPYLQVILKDPPEDQVLQRNVDFFIDMFRDRKCLRFDSVFVHEEPGSTVPIIIVDDPTPPARLWAEFTYIDNRQVIESNFGVAADFTLDDLEKIQAASPGDLDYLSAVQGLWYVFFHAPTPYNLRIGTQILLGLPFSEEDGLIEEIRPNFSAAGTRVLIRDKEETGIVRSYTYQDGLDLEINPETGVEYVEGDSIQKFAPLSTGVVVYDYLNNPQWMSVLISQGVFREIEKFHKFFVRIESPAFSLAGAVAARKLALAVKPMRTYPLTAVRYEVGPDDIDITDIMALTVKLGLHDGPCFDLWGSANIWNEGDPGVVTIFPPPDGRPDLLTAPPVPGVDTFTHHENQPWPPAPWYSSWESEYTTHEQHDVGMAGLDKAGGFHAPIVWPQFLDPNPVPLESWDFELEAIRLYFELDGAAEATPTYDLDILVNSFVVLTLPFTVIWQTNPHGGNDFFELRHVLPASLTINSGDTVQVRLSPSGVGTGNPNWTNVEGLLFGKYLYENPDLMWGYGYQDLCPDDEIQLTHYMAWASPMMVQYNTIFSYGLPVYPAYVDPVTSTIVLDLGNPTLSVPPGSGLPGWSFGQVLNPPPPPYTGYASIKVI